MACRITGLNFHCGIGPPHNNPFDKEAASCHPGQVIPRPCCLDQEASRTVLGPSHTWALSTTKTPCTQTLNPIHLVTVAKTLANDAGEHLKVSVTLPCRPPSRTSHICYSRMSLFSSLCGRGRHTRRR